MFEQRRIVARFCSVLVMVLGAGIAVLSLWRGLGGQDPYEPSAVLGGLVIAGIGALTFVLSGRGAVDVFFADVRRGGWRTWLSCILLVAIGALLGGGTLFAVDGDLTTWVERTDRPLRAPAWVPFGLGAGLCALGAAGIIGLIRRRGRRDTE